MGESSFMRLSQKARGLDVWLEDPDTLTQFRRWLDNTLPTMSLSWNSVNPLASWQGRQVSVSQDTRTASGQRIAEKANAGL
jgi:hypothetical protein